MSKPVKRAVILDFLENALVRCEFCGKNSKIYFSCRNCREHVKLKDCNFFHLIPLASGGQENFTNVIMLCPKCSREVELVREKLRAQRNRKITSY